MSARTMTADRLLGGIQHELGAAAYAIKAVQAAAPKNECQSAGQRECQWQRNQLPDAIRELVLDDQRRRNAICWSVFDC